MNFPDLFDHEPWNHIPQVVESGTCNNCLCSDHVGFVHGLWTMDHQIVAIPNNL